ncbi:MAG: PilN domain-containing protein, partial [bacterium]|nr:PilN domain-containing protein [bacterium]
FLFEQKKTEISKQKKINIKKAKKIQFISETELNKLAVESLIYQLSLLDVKELYLTKVDITGSNILITGKIHKSKSQFLLTDYIDKLEKLPYISDIYFEIKKGDFEFSNFIIKGRLSGRARK